MHAWRSMIPNAAARECYQRIISETLPSRVRFRFRSVAGDTRTHTYVPRRQWRAPGLNPSETELSGVWNALGRDMTTSVPDRRCGSKAEPHRSTPPRPPRAAFLSLLIYIFLSHDGPTLPNRDVVGTHAISGGVFINPGRTVPVFFYLDRKKSPGDAEIPMGVFRGVIPSSGQRPAFLINEIECE